MREEARRAVDLVLGLVPTRSPWRKDLPRRANLDGNSSGVTIQ